MDGQLSDVTVCAQQGKCAGDLEITVEVAVNPPAGVEPGEYIKALGAIVNAGVREGIQAFMKQEERRMLYGDQA